MSHIQSSSPPPLLLPVPPGQWDLVNLKRNKKPKSCSLRVRYKGARAAPAPCRAGMRCWRGAGLYKSADLGMIPLAYELLMRYEL